MQTHLEEAADPKDNTPARLAQGSRVQKIHLRWVSHAMTENDAQCGVTFSEKRLQVVRHAKKRNFKYLLTGNESWFYYEYAHDSAWAPSRGLLPTRKAQKI
jgi:hypothetical protein